MTSKAKWRVEGLSVDSENGEILDWVALNPGPAMRAWFGNQLKPGIGPSHESIMLSVIDLSTGKGLRAKVIKDRRRYRAKYNGELLTLEAATKMMKEDLSHGR